MHEHPIHRDAVDVLAMDFEIVHGRVGIEQLDARDGHRASMRVDVLAGLELAGWYPVFPID